MLADEAHEPKTDGLKGVRIKTISIIVVILTLAFGFALIATSQAIDQTSRELKDATDRFIICEQAASNMKDTETYLTTRACAFVTTHDLTYLEQYFEEENAVQSREAAARELEEQLTNAAARDYFRTAMLASEALTQREHYAMALSAHANGIEVPEYASSLNELVFTATDRSLPPEGQQDRAEALMFDNQYQIIKDNVESNIASCINELIAGRDLDQSAATNRLGVLLNLQSLFTILLMAAAIAAIGSVMILVLRPVADYTARIKENRPLVLAGSHEIRFMASAYNSMYEETKRFEDNLKHQAEHDPLTDLLNRNAYDEDRRDKNKHRALLLIDVDHFKSVNDTYGHDTGDLILKKMADAMRRTFRSTDYPYRIGGDEFAVIMEDVTSAERSVIERKVKYMSEYMASENDGLPSVTLSVGVAFSEDVVDKEIGFYKAADIALYSVKDAGRNGYAFYRDVEGEGNGELTPGD